MVTAMTIFGKAVKGIVERAAYGADLVMNKTAQGIEKKFGEREIVKTVSEIGSGTVRVTQTTLKTVTDVVDGGLEAGWGYLSHDEEKKNQGWETSKTAGKDFLTGVGKGLVYTVAAGAVTASSAVTAGKHLVQGERDLARQEFDQTKGYAKHLGKTVVVGMLAFGPPPQALQDEATSQAEPMSENQPLIPEEEQKKQPE